MSNLAGFFKPLYTEETREVVISDRFVDDDGKPLAFKLKTLSQDQMKAISKRSVKDKIVNGKKSQELDHDLFISRCLVESCIQPDFKDTELCKHYGTLDPYELPQKMLLVREYEKLGRTFIELNGLESEDIDIGEVTKN